ncbi:MAG: Ig-like domain-containing protein, partial [Gemmatimonadetes bacterium]|nr:Ig-like domain-containing protein [Gemmatimonadota bacterium]
TVTASRYFVDPDGDSLGFTAESSDSARVAVELEAGTAVLTVRALARGTATITVTVTDPEGLGATSQFTVTVPNRAPQTTSGIANQRAAPGDMFVFDLATRFTDPDGDSLTFTATSSNAAVATATLSGARLTVRALARGTARITVTATDPAGHAARQRFTVRVPNRAPNPTGTIPDTYLAPGEFIDLSVSGYFTDPENDPLTFTASSSNPTVATATPSGDTVTVSGFVPGTATITVTATDPGGLSATHDFPVTVEDIHTNSPPVPRGTIPNVDLDPDATSTTDVSGYFTDPEGDPLDFAASSSNTGVAEASADGDFVTVTGIAAGTATITVTATDPGGLDAAHSFTATVAESSTNRAPRPRSTMPDAYLETGSVWTVNAGSYFTDPDRDPLTHSASSSNVGVATASASGTTITVTGVAAGTATITVTATDPGGLSGTQSLTASVRDPVSGDGFEIDLIFTAAVPATYRPALEAGTAAWMAILEETEWPDVPINGTRECRGVDVDLDVVDDMAIVVDAVDIDGDGGTVASASTCMRRDEAGAPILGSIRFDLADLDLLVDHGDLVEIMMHEVTHVLGFGFRWVILDLLVQGTGVDHHFTGPRAIAAFDAAGGTSYTGAKVPTQPGQGHWRESVLGQELMTPNQVLGARDPLSLITLEALVDMGFSVDLSAADAYTLPSPRPPLAGAERRTIDLGDDIDRGPVMIVDRNGRTVRVVWPDP